MDNLRQRQGGGYTYMSRKATEVGVKIDAVEIDLSYSEGTGFTASSQKNKRGLYIHVTPVTLELRPGGYVTKMQEVFSGWGRKVFILPMKRRNARVMADQARKLDLFVEDFAKLFHENPLRGFERVRDIFPEPSQEMSAV